LELAVVLFHCPVLFEVGSGAGSMR
jgi:hypothetical protein